MAKSNRRIRERRAARRQSAAAAPAGRELLPHTQQCPCKQCEDGRQRQITRGVTATEKRRGQYFAGHSCPEHRDEWRTSGHPLIAYFATHEASRDRKAHLTRVEMKDDWVNHLDGVVGERALDAGRLYEALLVLEAVHPLRGRIMRAYTIEGRTQEMVGQQEHMTYRAVGQNLEAAADLLLAIYGGLLLVEEHAAAAAAC